MQLSLQKEFLFRALKKLTHHFCLWLGLYILDHPKSLLLSQQGLMASKRYLLLDLHYLHLSWSLSFTNTHYSNMKNHCYPFLLLVYFPQVQTSELEYFYFLFVLLHAKFQLQSLHFLYYKALLFDLSLFFIGDSSNYLTLKFSLIINLNSCPHFPIVPKLIFIILFYKI